MYGEFDGMLDETIGHWALIFWTAELKCAHHRDLSLPLQDPIKILRYVKLYLGMKSGKKPQKGKIQARYCE